MLVHARVEGGFLDTVELGPTVQYTPDNYAHLPEKERPPFLDTVLEAPAERIRYEAVHAEEGGRLKKRLNELMNDALVLAKQVRSISGARFYDCGTSVLVPLLPRSGLLR